MKVKIKASMLTKWPIWRVYAVKGSVEIDFYDRQKDDFKGLTKEQLIKILQKKGYEVIGK